MGKRKVDELTKWVEDTGAKKAAKLLGVSESFVCRLKSGRRRPSVAIAARLFVLTDGKVTPEFWSKRRVRREASADPR